MGSIIGLVDSKYMLLPLVMLLALYCMVPAESVSSDQEIGNETGTLLPKNISELTRKAAQKGQVAVIVGLKLSGPGFKPEGTLSGPEAVEQQRQAIVTTRKDLLKNLAGYKFTVYAVWNSVPYVAMKVDAKALEYLINNPLVTSIHEDSERDPHKTETSVEGGEDGDGNTRQGGFFNGNK